MLVCGHHTGHEMRSVSAIILLMSAIIAVSWKSTSADAFPFQAIRPAFPALSSLAIIAFDSGINYVVDMCDVCDGCGADGSGCNNWL